MSTVIPRAVVFATIIFGPLIVGGALWPTLAMAEAPDLRVTAKTFGADNRSSGQPDIVVLHSGSVVQTGDGIRLSVRTEARVYLYVFAVGASGSAVLLHPITRRSEQALTQAGEVVVIPEGGAFLPLDRHIGREFIVALSSRSPVRDIDALLLMAENAVAANGRLEARELAAFGEAAVAEFAHVASLSGTGERHVESSPASAFARSPDESGVLVESGTQIQALLGGSQPAEPKAPAMVRPMQLAQEEETPGGFSLGRLFGIDEKQEPASSSQAEREQEGGTWDQLFTSEPNASGRDGSGAPKVAVSGADISGADVSTAPSPAVSAERVDNGSKIPASYTPARGPLYQETLSRLFQLSPAKTEVNAARSTAEGQGLKADIAAAPDTGDLPGAEEASTTFEVAQDSEVSEAPSLSSWIFGADSTDQEPQREISITAAVQEVVLADVRGEASEADTNVNAARPATAQDDDMPLLSRLLDSGRAGSEAAVVEKPPLEVVPEEAGVDSAITDSAATDNISDNREASAGQEDDSSLLRRLFGGGLQQGAENDSRDPAIEAQTVAAKATAPSQREPDVIERSSVAADAPPGVTTAAGAVSSDAISFDDERSFLSRLFSSDALASRFEPAAVRVERSGAPPAPVVAKEEAIAAKEALAQQETVEQDSGIISSITDFLGLGRADEPEPAAPVTQISIEEIPAARVPEPRIVMNEEDGSVRLPQIGGADTGTAPRGVVRGGSGVLRSAGAQIAQLLGGEGEPSVALDSSDVQPDLEPPEASPEPVVVRANGSRVDASALVGESSLSESGGTFSTGRVSRDVRPGAADVTTSILPKIETPVTAALEQQGNALVRAGATQTGLDEIALSASRTRTELSPVVDGQIVRSVVLVVSPKGRGTGMVVDKKGHILTNWQVVRGFRRVSVWLKAPALDAADLNRPMTALVARTNRASDLALLRIEGGVPDLEPLPMAADVNVLQGEPVHLLSHAGVGQWQYTPGVFVAAKPRHSWLSDGRYVHKAAVVRAKLDRRSPEVGGPLLNDSMEMVGISSQVAKRSAHIYAVSVEGVRRFLSAEAALSQ